jgi:hypothetical protein
MSSLISCTQKKCKSESKKVDKEIKDLQKKLSKSKNSSKLIEQFNNGSAMKKRNECSVKKCLPEVKKDLKDVAKYTNKATCKKQAQKLIKQKKISEKEYTKLISNVSKL